MRPVDLVGRTELLTAVTEGLRASGRVVLTGPRGIGKSAVLAAVAARAGEPVLALNPARSDRDLPFGAVADLFCALPAEDLPEGQAAAVHAVLRHTSRDGREVDPLAVRLALSTLLGRAAPVLLVIDELPHLDPDSARALDHALRRHAEVHVLAAGPGGELCGPDRVELTVPPLDFDEVAELLAADGVPYRLAWSIHRLSGGFPHLARELGRGRQHAAAELARAWLAEAPAPALLVAALAARPTPSLLRRACGPRVERELRAATAAGLLTVTEDRIRFTAGILPDTVIADSDWTERAAAHTLLAGAVHSRVEAAGHRARATDGPDAGLAAELAAGASASVRRGDWSTAAELGLLAAERTPPQEPELVLRRLVEAAAAAGRAGRVELARRAADQALARDDSPDNGVRVRLAIVDAAGQAIDDCDELLAEAAAAAGEDPALLAGVVVRQAIKANLAEGDPVRARAEARRAAVLAAQGGDPATEVMALTMQARMERVLGDPAARQTLEFALGVPGQPEPRELGNSPRFLAARHALFDDRLVEARTRLLELLPAAQLAGATEYVEISRSLAEVEARAGRCADALEHARRAVAATRRLGLSPGPSLYTAAVAETAGGSFARAADYARRGVQASREEHDVVFLSRNLHALGLVELVTGDPARALEVLRQVGELEAGQHVADPSLLRWHGDLAEALAATGSPDLAADLIERVGPRTPAVQACLDRAQAACLVAQGDPSGALTILSTVECAFESLPLERGRTLLAVAKVERRLRHWAAARAALETAVELFEASAARPWRELALASMSPRPSGADSALTAAEERLAELVVQGASNQEAADKLFLSVKTVESMLTRIYRKLGVSSRAQLGNLRRG
ncbi:LuxR family transcriptional regulator [Kutzneria viridogrisea]|uniref:DNA-binding CsgD family transcriptional regulator n=1 Tax=Kutzneria viridogrisea TaxID=47990 RepID=A0ABR6BU18_9PSEU|nr:DNA-binding CsgD family transcriptional regulator [Kutzneria viridogrisea]